MLSGISQSLTVLSLVPLADILGLSDFGDNPITDHFKKISEITIGFPIVKILGPKNFREIFSQIFFGNFEFSNRFRIFCRITVMKKCF